MDSVAILVPSLNRPSHIRPLLRNIAAMTPDPHSVHFAVSDPLSVEFLQAAGIEPLVDEGRSWPHRINDLYRQTDAPWVFLGSDDLFFHPDWLGYARRVMEAVPGVIPVNDLHNPNGTSALVARSYIESGAVVDQPGNVVFDGYQHNFADTELFEVARTRNLLRYCAESVVEHMHPFAGKGEMDATYERSCATAEEDRVLFESRRPLWR